MVFGALGGFAGPLGLLVGSTFGGIGGYFAAPTLAKGLAQFALGQQVDAFPENSVFGNINDLLNGVGPKTPTTAPIPDALLNLSPQDLMPGGSDSDVTNEGMITQPVPNLGFLSSAEGLGNSGLSTGSGASSLVPTNVRTDRVDLLATNATLKSMNFDGGGSVAVVNAVTNNDNKQASNFFPMNVVERPQGFVKDATNALLA